MLFTELRFIPFFLLVFCGTWSLRGNRTRKLWLLLWSYAFYAAWDWHFLSLILISTIIDFVAARAIGRTDAPRTRKRWLVLSIVANLGLLGIFKYAGFFIDSASEILAWLGLPASEFSLRLILPVGISFYTFQSLSTTLDVYFRKLAPPRSPLDFALFVGFFPQLVAGPIVRAADFFPQLQRSPRWSSVRVRACLTLFLIGFMKKAVVADGVSPLVDTYFANPMAYGALSAWLAALLFAVQIYCDFSGYSDMAIATAGLLGYNLRLNFNFPYFAANLRDFWRRWHISLSTWLRDYLYIPLGGNRGGLLRQYRNLMITMLLGGLWHGAAWTFILWGALHGIGLIAVDIWSRWIKPRLPHFPLEMLGKFTGSLLTFFWVCLGWMLFRAENLDSARTVFHAALWFDSPGERLLGDRLHWLIIALALVHLVAYRFVRQEFLWCEKLPRWFFALMYGAIWAIVTTLLHPHARPFIYFQF